MEVPSSTPDPPAKWVVKHDIIGNPLKMVAVPTHFFKVFCTCGENQALPSVFGSRLLLVCSVEGGTCKMRKPPAEELRVMKRVGS